MDKIIVIGYSGHSFVVNSIFESIGKKVYAYCDSDEKDFNPLGLQYLGKESDPQVSSTLSTNPFFIAIGNNKIRRKIYEGLTLPIFISPINAVHKNAVICVSAKIYSKNIMIGAGVVINALAVINDGVICNTGCIIEHECIVESFAHIGPGAILCGNVTVGENSFIGAGSVVRQGIKIGRNVTVGAGSVVVKDIADNMTVMGCPAK